MNCFKIVKKRKMLNVALIIRKYRISGNCPYHSFFTASFRKNTVTQLHYIKINYTSNKLTENGLYCGETSTKIHFV